MTCIELKSGKKGYPGKRISINIDKIESVYELFDWDEDDRKHQPHIHCRVSVTSYGSFSVSETYDEVMRKIKEAEKAEEDK